MTLLGLMVVLGACSRGESADAPDGSIELDKAAAAKAAAPRAYTLAGGTHIEAAISNEISSRHGVAGDVFSAVVVTDVKGPTGAVAIPTGATLSGSIVEVSPAPNDGSLGTLVLKVSSVTVRGATYPLDVSIDSLMTVQEGRGLERADVIRVVGGATAGAAVGQIISKDTKGTIIGGIIGAAAGGAVSALVKDQDIVLPSGARLMLTLLQSVTVKAQ
jgi:hypothetical protein